MFLTKKKKWTSKIPLFELMNETPCCYIEVSLEFYGSISELCPLNHFFF